MGRARNDGQAQVDGQKSMLASSPTCPGRPESVEAAEESVYMARALLELERWRDPRHEAAGVVVVKAGEHQPQAHCMVEERQVMVALTVAEALFVLYGRGAVDNTRQRVQRMSKVIRINK